jgi:hypothetical protein
MVLKLGDIRSWNLPNPTWLCFHMVENSETRGREDPWLHMGIFQGMH